ncbi:ATP-binding protein [Desulfosporosinus fructosivorans]
MVIARFYSIEDWEKFVDMKMELIDLKTQRFNLQGIVDDNSKELEKIDLKMLEAQRLRFLSMIDVRTKELKQEIEKMEFIELEAQRLNLQGMIDDRTEELRHEVKKIEFIELEAQRLNLQEIIDDRSEELKHEVEKRERIELEVAKLERLNIIGQLAAGLAHEVRNPMTTIRGFLQMLQNKTDLLTYKSYFDLMIEELDRTNTIITDFLSLVKNKPTKLKRQCLNKLLDNIFPLLLADAYTQGKKSIFEPRDIAELDIDTNEITQLVLNLARNGLDAMHPDGCLTIKTFMDGQNIVLSVRDEGTGINPEHLSKLGTPFFTTKESGTGLGLPMCYSIANRHRAQIDVKTGSDGTTFLVRFPQPIGLNII